MTVVQIQYPSEGIGMIFFTVSLSPDKRQKIVNDYSKKSIDDFKLIVVHK